MKYKNYQFFIIDNKEKLFFYKIILTDLLATSLFDKAILGFGDSFNDQLYVNSYFSQIENEIERKNLVIIISVNNTNDKALSTCQIKMSNSDTTKHVANLQKGIIHPTQRGTFLLKRTLFEISSYCLENNIELLTLDVREGSPAHKIWLKSGFKAYGILNDYCRLNNRSFKGIYMSQTVIELYDKTKPKIN